MDEIDYRLSEILEVLGNGLRLQMVILMRERPRRVGELADEIDRAMQTTSGHLKKLRDSDLVQAESRGSGRVYSLKRPKLIEKILELRTDLRREESDE